MADPMPSTLPGAIPADSPEAAQLLVDAPSTPVVAPQIFQPSATPAVTQTPVTQNPVTAPIPADSPEAGQLLDAPPQGKTPVIYEEGSPAADQLVSHVDYLSKLAPNQIAAQYRADRAAGRATDSKDYEEAYENKVKNGGVLESLAVGVPKSAAAAAAGFLTGGIPGAVEDALKADTPEGKTPLGHLLDMGTALLAGGISHYNAITGTLTGVDVDRSNYNPWKPVMMTSAEHTQAAAELVAGHESAFLNNVFLLRQGAVNIWNAYAHTTNNAGDKAAFKDQFHTEVDLQDAKERVAAGGSVFERPGAFGVLSEPHYVDRKTVEQHSQSPLSDFSAFLPGMAAAKGAEIADVAAKAQTIIEATEVADRASLVARSAAKTAEVVSATLKKGGSVFDNTPKILKAGIAAAATHAAGGDAAFSTLMGFLAGKESKTVAALDVATGALDSAATSLRTPTPAGPLSKFAATSFQSLTTEAKSAAISLAFNLPFALGAQSQDEAIDTLTVGLLAHGFVRGAQLTPKAINALSPTTQMWHEAPRPAADRTPVKDYGIDPTLDNMHRDVVKIANNAGNNLIQAARNLLTRSGSKGELYLGRPEDIAHNLVDMSARGVTFLDPKTGQPVGMTPETAKFWSKQAGVTFQVEMPPETPAVGQPAEPPVRRNIAIVPFSEGAPALSVGHELWHVLENTVVSPEERAHFETEATRIYGGVGSLNFENARRYYARLLGDDPTTLSDSRVASELMAETMSGRLNATPVGAFGPGGEMTFKNSAYRRFIRDTAAFTEKILTKLGADVPETVVHTVLQDSQGRPYVTLMPGGKGARSGLGWQLSSELGALVDNFLESKRLDTAVAEAQGHPDPFTEVQGAPTADNPIQNVREVAPEPAFKKGDPIDDVKNGKDEVVGTDAVVTKVIPDAKGDHQYEIEYTDPADGKRKVGVVPEKLLQSTVNPGAGPAGEPTKAQRGIESVTKPVSTNTETRPTLKPVGKENSRQVSESERRRILGTPEEPRLATSEVIEHNKGVIGEEVGKAASEQRLLRTDYYSASEAKASDTAPVREARRNLVERADPTTTKGLRALYEKLVHIYKYNPTPGNGRPFVTAFSFDNFIRNLEMVDGWLRSKGLKNDPALKRMKDSDFGQAVQNYWRNQANGYRGDGERLVRPADIKPESIPAENANYTPVPVSKHDLEIINLAMGIELPKTSSVATRYAAKMARENGHTPTTNKAGVEITNPFTADLIAKGFDPNILHSTVQQLSVDKLASKLTPSEYKGTSRAVLATVRAGFMPSGKTAVPHDPIADYADRPETFGGRLISADLIRTKLPGYDPKNPGATHPEASRFSNELFEAALSRPGVQAVTFTGGPPGAGKTTAISDEVAKRPDGMVFDSTLGGTSGAARVQQAVEAGKTVELVFVYAPFDTAAERVAGRARETGRTVPASSIIENYRTSLENFTSLAEEYRNNPNVNFRVLDNSGKIPVPVLDKPIEFLHNALHELPSDASLAERLTEHPEIPQDVPGAGEGPGGRDDAPDGARGAAAGEGSRLKNVEPLVPESPKIYVGDDDFISLGKRPFAAQKNLAVPPHFIDEAAHFMPSAKVRLNKEELPDNGSFYRVLPEGDDALTGSKFLMSPDGRWISVKDHEKAATEMFQIAGPSYGSSDDLGKLEKDHGFARVVRTSEALYVTDQVSKSQLKVLEMAAIESGKKLVHDYYDIDSEKRHEKTIYTPPSESDGAHFMPRSNELKTELEKKGYSFEFDKPSRNDTGVIRVEHEGKEVGRMDVEKDGKVGIVTGIDVHRAHRNQGIGELLYRMAGNWLKEAGIKSVVGDVYGSQALRLREKVFGPSAWLGVGGEPVERADATTNLPKFAKFGAGVDPTEAISRISPSAQFLPKTAAQHAGEHLEHAVGDDLNLIHFGGSGMREIDPKNFGKSGLTPRSELSGAPRSYFYEQGAHNPTDPVAQRGDVYGAKVSGNRIYDGDKDPLDYSSIVNREKADDMLKDEGYVGIARTAGTGKKAYRQVELFKPTRVSPIDDPDATFMPRASDAQEKALKDSKVRGPNGKLLPVFHGTYSDFKHFGKGDLGFHFGTQEAAAARIGDALKTGEVPAEDAFSAFRELRDNLPPGSRGALEGIADGARTLPVFLDLKNPLRMFDVGPWDDPSAVLQALQLDETLPYTGAGMKDVRAAVTKYIDGETTLKRASHSGPIKNYAEKVDALAKTAMSAIRDKLKELGYDGVVYANEHEGSEADSYIAFDNKQIVPAYAADAKARFMPAAPKTPEFKKWFGDSKVVDEAGDPKAVYHGTNSADFDAFDKNALGKSGTAASRKAFFFTDSPEVSGMFSGEVEGSRTIPVYLQMKNPIVTDHEQYTASELSRNGHDLRRDAVQRAIRDGRDGVIFKNSMDYLAHRATIYAVLEPSQIKSAIGNAGSFDPENPSIRFMPREKLAVPGNPELQDAPPSRPLENSPILNSAGADKKHRGRLAEAR